MTQLPYDHGGDASEPLREVMARIRSELVDVAQLIERLEPLLSNGRSTEFLASPDHMRVMQGIDLAVQKTHGLADFWTASVKGWSRSTSSTSPQLSM
jgi:hypothetical protein